MLNLQVTSISNAHAASPSMTKIISLVDPGTNPPVHDARCHVEHFHDISYPGGEFIAPDGTKIGNVLRFSETFTEDDRILVHCSQGISRSTAIAIAVLVQHGTSPRDAADHVRKLQPAMKPNILVIGHADRILNQDGELIRAVLSGDVLSDDDLIAEIMSLLV